MRLKQYINEAKNPVLQQPTVDKINNMAKEQKLKAIVKKIFAYGKKGDHEGWAMARIMTTNMMNDFVLAMGSEYEKGKKFNLDSELKKKKYDKVTEPFSEWFKEYVTIVYKNLYGK